MFKRQEILDIWSPYVTATKLRRGSVYYYESLLECSILVGRLNSSEVSSIEHQGGPDKLAEMVSYDGQLFRPIARVDGTFANISDLITRPTESLIGRTSDLKRVWWVDHPAALYLTDQDLPPIEPLLRTPRRDDWWGDQSLMIRFNTDQASAERRAGELTGELLVVGELPMRRCHLPGVAIDAASEVVTLRPWIYPHPRPFAPFTAYLPGSQAERSIYVEGRDFSISPGQSVEPEPQAAEALARRCTLSAALETVFSNLSSFDQTAISHLDLERPGLSAALALGGEKMDAGTAFLADMLTATADEKLLRYGGILHQTMTAKGFHDEELANLLSGSL